MIKLVNVVKHEALGTQVHWNEGESDDGGAQKVSKFKIYSFLRIFN